MGVTFQISGLLQYPAIPLTGGVLGDYIGGILNPLISLITLFYLLKTYLTQKEELDQSEKAAQKTANTQLLNTLILASYEKITLYRGEMEGVTRAMNGPRGGQSFTAIDGNLYRSDEQQKKYRKMMVDKIKSELETIDKYLEEIKNLSN
ncbi:hypothetical protein IE995_07960 [Klebsiella pneumoniae]|nr:hypothetical protein [Klebsiella pneumoniae]